MRRAKGTIRVFTFKEGLLSAVAHDLQLRLDKFDITMEGEVVNAEFQLPSLTLEGPVEHGVVKPDQYDAGKRADVHKAMNQDILHTDQHPTARFTGRAVPRGEGYDVTGDLELAGKKAPLAFPVVKQGNEYRGEVEIKPSNWGVAQYKAMLGAIRLKDQVRIVFALTDA
jgi:polyisoprenoid-binding protein YceI